MSRAHRSLCRPALLLGLAAAALLTAGCSADAPEPVAAVQQANLQTARQIELERWEKMLPPSAAADASGLTPVVVIRSPDELGAIASALPKDFDFASSMLIYIGKAPRLKSRLDIADTLVLVEADARDPYSPGVSVTDSAMSSVVGLTFGADPCCRGTEPVGDDPCVAEREREANTYANNKLVLFAAPRIDQPVQVMVQHTPCASQ